MKLLFSFQAELEEDKESNIFLSDLSEGKNSLIFHLKPEEPLVYYVPIAALAAEVSRAIVQLMEFTRSAMD